MRRKWTIAVTALVTTVLAVIVALMLPNIYRAETLLAPNGDDGASGLSRLAAQYGGLASLAGIDLGGRSTDKTAFGLEVLKSRRFIAEFIARREILVPLIATKHWDAATDSLVIDEDIFDPESGKWVRKVRPPRTQVPSGEEAYEAFREILAISQDEKTGFVTISVEHESPAVAAAWTGWLVEDLNATIMRRDVAEAEQAIEYLEDQISKTSLAELQNVFFGLIEEQMKTVMLARVSDEYLFKIIDPAMRPERRAKPSRALISILGLLLGLGLAIVWVTLRSGDLSPSDGRSRN